MRPLIGQHPSNVAFPLECKSFNFSSGAPVANAQTTNDYSDEQQYSTQRMASESEPVPPNMMQPNVRHTTVADQPNIENVDVLAAMDELLAMNLEEDSQEKSAVTSEEVTCESESESAEESDN